MNAPSDTSGPACSYYPARHAALTTASQTLGNHARRLRLALLFFGGVSAVILIEALEGALRLRLIVIPLILAFAVLNRYLRAQREHARLQRLIDYYDRSIARMDGTQTQSGHTGEEFRSETHLYDRDLLILGPDSLFGMLATTRTGLGQRGLANTLLHPPNRADLLEHRAAIQELSPRNDLREQVHLLGDYQFQQVAATFFDEWLDDPPPTFHPAFRYILFTTTSAIFALLIAGVIHLGPWSTIVPNLIAVIALQTAIGMYLRKRVLPLLKNAYHLSNQMDILRDGLALLQRTSFASPKLLTLQQLSLKPGNAVSALKKIQNQLTVAEQREKGEWILALFLLVCAGTHAAISIANWKRQYATSMKQWLAVWAEFESLSALATYAYEHPQNVYPEILPSNTAVFEATSLAHPLLPANAVSNDIALNTSGRENPTSLYLISGSNMAGKSTLLRAIGSNAVLALAGAPIRATTARISPLHIGASISVTDSLAEGKSKFLAEVERLHAILKASDEGPLLFLIDEIFSGTNSLDRRIAAEAVARTLTTRNAIGALSTHDLTLTEMAANPALRAVNVHMGSPNPAAPLAFDYRLKPGVNPTTNALAILALIGIDVE
ncbi:MAG: hypothetical protein ABI197_05390 [Granulicella sp.]